MYASGNTLHKLHVNIYSSIIILLNDIYFFLLLFHI